MHTIIEEQALKVRKGLKLTKQTRNTGYTSKNVTKPSNGYCDCY